MGSSAVSRIRKSGLSIYDSLEDRPELLIDHVSLERILNKALAGLDLKYPLRTRSKIVKTAICGALGYPIPTSFRKTQPRFPGQDFDTFVQKADNLQIWNEEVTASRRYVLIRVNEQSVVTRVRVVTGEVIARFDKTGTLTHKYQAKSRSLVAASMLGAPQDTPRVTAKLIQSRHANWPDFLPISTLYERLVKLTGNTFADPGQDQERNRGSALHEAVCRQLGMKSWNEDGQFPDVTEQLLEIKLQTASTIDLGLVCPNHKETLADSAEFRHCDVRYAVFYATRKQRKVRLDHLVLTTGAKFFRSFQQFRGKVRNAKIQIPLPRDFFD